MTKANRWGWIAGLVALTAAGLVLFFLLSIATGNRAAYETYYVWLFWVNVVVALLLLLVIVVALVRLQQRVRGGIFGSRLLLRLVGIFAFVGIVPGVLIYTVSYQFVARSIESWFDVKVEGALDAGLALGRDTLDVQVRDIAAKTLLAAERLAEERGEIQPLALERLREQLAARELAVVGAQGAILVAAGGAGAALTPDRPSAALLRQARGTPVASQLEGLDEEAQAGAVPARVRALARIPSGDFALGTQDRFLLVTQALPRGPAANALAVQAAYREYQQRALARDGLRRMYIGTLTLALFLAVFGAVLLAVLLGNQLIRPLIVLAEGMREVAAGNLAPKAALPSRDELAGLTRTFALMTQDLSDAREAVQHSMEQVDAARENLQTILDNLTAGVLVFDERGRLLSANPGAARILHAALNAHIGQPLDQVPGLEQIAGGVLQQFERFLAEDSPHEGGYWQESFELSAGEGSPFEQGITLIARGALLPDNQRLLVFDDVSEVVSAQRAKAWGEVARRLAHEIKNPLTPIQLSAERLAMKLDGKLQPPEQALLDKSVRTIGDQVEAMKRLVNEFRDYARLPAAQLAPLDLNAAVRDILSLYDNAAVPVRCELAEDLPKVRADAQQVRQIVHNLVQNAQDAMGGMAGAEVLLRTRRSDSGQWVRLVVSDSGPGFGENILKRAFEPYVTTKAKGTGLGLAVVKKIMDEHGGRVDLSNRVTEGRVIGAQVSLSFAVAN